MYNRISKLSAISVLVAAALFIAFMVMVPFLNYTIDEDLGAALFIFLFGAYSGVIIYVSQVPFVIVALVFGIKMLKEQSRERLVSFNKRMFIAALVLAPFVALGLAYVLSLFSISAIEIEQGIFTCVVTAVYAVCLIVPIVTIILLKRAPEESNATD